MEKLTQLIHAVYEQMGALAWVALGVLLPFSIILAIVVLRWIRHGGLAAGTSHSFFAQQEAIARWLRKR